MSLYSRLLGIDVTEESPKIHAHGFASAMGEFERGLATRAQLLAAFGIAPAEEADFDTLAGKIKPQPESYAIGAFVNVANVGTAYDAVAAAKGLGFIAVDPTGITRLELQVRYNKIGTGTLSWQLWNDTDGAEVGVFNDSAAAGDNKVAQIIVTPASPMTASGFRVLRPRVKSTVAADDPVYYGSCLVVRRVARLTAADLHELLILADEGVAYTTEAALRTRLGV